MKNSDFTKILAKKIMIASAILVALLMAGAEYFVGLENIFTIKPTNMYPTAIFTPESPTDLRQVIADADAIALVKISEISRQRYMAQPQEVLKGEMPDEIEILCSAEYDFKIGGEYLMFLSSMADMGYGNVKYRVLDWDAIIDYSRPIIAMPSKRGQSLVRNAPKTRQGLKQYVLQSLEIGYEKTWRYMLEVAPGLEEMYENSVLIIETTIGEISQQDAALSRIKHRDTVVLKGGWDIGEKWLYVPAKSLPPVGQRVVIFYIEYSDGTLFPYAKEGALIAPSHDQWDEVQELFKSKK